MFVGPRLAHIQKRDGEPDGTTLQYKAMQLVRRPVHLLDRSIGDVNLVTFLYDVGVFAAAAQGRVLRVVPNRPPKESLVSAEVEQAISLVGDNLLWHIEIPP